MSKRANGEGSLYQQGDRWVGAVDLGYVDGKRRRKRVTAATQGEALAKLRRLQQQLERGVVEVDAQATAATWLEVWLDTVVAGRVDAGRLRVTTAMRYRQHVEQHLVPTLGRVKLAKLTPQHVRQLHADLRGKGLSPATVTRVHATLRKALSDAVADELVARNVAKIVPPPSAPRPEVQPLTLDQARMLLDEVQGSRHEAVYVLMLTVGLRVGEVLGLRWSDVDLDGGQLRVRRQLQRVAGQLEFSPPKSARSRRTVSLPSIAVDALVRHRRRQTVATLDGLVFPSLVGTPMEPRNLQRHWHGLRARIGLDEVRLHDLRHSAASLMLVGGVPMRAVMETLGHSSIALTADTYSHVLDEVRRDVATRMDGVLGGRGSQRGSHARGGQP
jgi:integrase